MVRTAVRRGNYGAIGRELEDQVRQNCSLLFDELSRLANQYFLTLIFMKAIIDGNIRVEVSRNI
jgi:hypothetical protein